MVHQSSVGDQLTSIDAVPSDIIGELMDHLLYQVLSASMLREYRHCIRSGSTLVPLLYPEAHNGTR